MDTEWKGSYASPTHEISPVLKEVILRICLVSKKTQSSASALTFWLACGLSVFQAGGDSCDVITLWFILCFALYGTTYGGFLKDNNILPNSILFAFFLLPMLIRSCYIYLLVTTYNKSCQ